METTETRRVGKHLFIFEKGKPDASSDGKNHRTLIASCADDNDEKLPREFVKYMRTLFDILDEGKRGFVELSDIEVRWGRKGGGHLGARPSDVLENLRRVAPPNGLLSFERLCLGFQLALRPSGGKKGELKEAKDEKGRTAEKLMGCELQGSKLKEEKSNRNGLAVLPSKPPHRRPRSMLQLRQQDELDLSVAQRKGGILEGIQKTDKDTVVDKLRQWKNEEQRKYDSRVPKEAERMESTFCTKGHGKGSDSECRPTKQHSTKKGARIKLPRVRVHYQGEKPNGLNGGSRLDCTGVHVDSKTVISKEAKLQDLEEDLKVLGEGLSTIEEVRDWLFTRITAIQEERLYVKSVDRYSSQDYEAMGHRMRRKELGLNSFNFKTFPKHMEGLKSQFCQILPEKPLNSSSPERLDSENKRKIAQLEKEKSALMRQLYQYKSQKERTK